MHRTTVPFELMSGLIVVTAEINGTPQRFIVDTGASHTVLTTRAAAALALPVGAEFPSRATGAVGGMSAAPVEVDTFIWGDATLNDVTLMQVSMDHVCGIAGTDVGGVIGYDVLSRFRFTVDYQQQHLVLEPTVSGN